MTQYDSGKANEGAGKYRVNFKTTLYY